MGQFIRESLDREGVIDISYRAKPSDSYMSRGRAIFNSKIRDIVGHIGPALLKVTGITVYSFHVKNRGYGGKDRSLQPCSGHSLGVQCRLHVHGGDGVVVVEFNVIFAAPDHLYRATGFLGENRSEERRVGKEC